LGLGWTNDRGEDTCEGVTMSATVQGTLPRAAVGGGRWQAECFSSEAGILPVIQRVLAAMAGLAYPEEDRYAVRLALVEALANAVKHGNRGDPSKWVDVHFQVSEEAVTVEVADQGAGFNPDRVPDPCDPGNWEKPSGRGLLIMRHYLTEVRHNERGNCVTLRKYRSAW
jgi:serine/threonine-protein kinase RsbW